MTWQSGDRVAGRFEIEGRLASGGMAEVYVARMRLARGVDRQVAIKRVHGHLAHDPDFVTMFLDEARVSSHLTHGGVVPVLDAVEARGELILVLEYVRGWDLRAVLREARSKGIPIPIPAAVQIARELAEILSYVHEATGPDGEPLQIVHRDVTPSNLLLAEDGSIRLLDFGVAKAASRATRTATDTLKGKLAYAAPEQLGGRVDARTDLYALGLTLFEMLTGRRALQADDQLQVIARAQSPDHVRASSLRQGIDGRLDDLIVHCLEVQPDDRPASARELVKRLEAIADEVGGVNRSAVRALVRDVMGKPSREPETGKTAFEGALAEVLGIGAGSTTGFVQTGEAPEDETAWIRPPPSRTVVDGAEDPDAAGAPSPRPEAARPEPTRSMWPVVLIGTIAAAAAVGGFAWVIAATATDETPAADDTSEAPAFLRVNSTPAGATVEVDGAREPTPTPTVIELAPGAHRIALSTDGYVTATREVELAPGASDAVELTLEAAPATLRVRSDPPGATVTVAGEERGVTPLALDGLAREAVDVTVALPRHVPHRERAPLDAEAEHTIDVTLRPRGGRPSRPDPPPATPALGRLNVSSTPWARVSVDGRVVAESTPAQGIRLPAGDHTVLLENPRLGLRATRRVTIREGATETLVVSLR